MEIILKEDTMCAGDRHEIMNYPRDGFVPKPTLPKGTILTVKERWHNFYGHYFRCYHKNGEYDIPMDKARRFTEEDRERMYG